MPRLCKVQVIETIAVETDNASETNVNTLVQADKTDGASEFNDTALIHTDKTSEIMNEQASGVSDPPCREIHVGTCYLRKVSSQLQPAFSVCIRIIGFRFSLRV